MHTPATPPGGHAHEHKTLLHLEAYLSHSLSITTQLIDSTRSRLSSLETQLATPAAAAGKTRKHLKSTRSRLAKKLRQCRAEAETLTRALDEVKAQIAGVEAHTRLSVLASGGGSWVSSPVDGMSERNGSISSYISSGELSAVAFAAANAAAGGGYAMSPVAEAAMGLPYIYTNIPAGIGAMHNLPSAPVYPMTPYSAVPYNVVWPQTPFIPMQDPWTAFPQPAGWVPYPSYPVKTYQATSLPPAPLTMPVAPSTWSFQQSPVETCPSPKMVAPALTRRYSVAATPATSEPVAVDVKKGRGMGHRRGVSCNVEELVRGWDAGTGA